MKKILQTVCICTILATFPTTSFAQKLSFGEFTGINFSNLYGNLTSKKWVPKAGLSSGFFMEYCLNRSFSVQTEIGLLTHHYGIKSYDYIRIKAGNLPANYSGSSSFQTLSSNLSSNRESNIWDFSFLRFPLFLKYNTSTRLKLGMGGGVFYSILTKGGTTESERNNAEKYGYDIYPPTHDWGYLLLADLSYPVANRFRIFVSGRLSTGKKVFIEQYRAKNGAEELLFGIKYTPGSVQNARTDNWQQSDPDTSFSHVYIKPVIGITMAWNSEKKKLGNYAGNTGPNTGLIVGYRLDKTVSLQTGFQFERKGYALTDTSLYYHRYVSDTRFPRYPVDTKVSLDYLTIPIDFKLEFGKRPTFYVDFGIYTGFMVNAICQGSVISKYSNEYAYHIEKINLNDAVEGYFKGVDFGYLSGLGFQFPIRKRMKLDLGIHYSESFNNVLNKPDEKLYEYANEDLSIKNASLSVQFGIQIPITQ